jgi:hypothetical protein
MTQSWRIRWAGQVARYRGGQKIRILVEQTGRRLLGRPMCRCKLDVELGLKEIVWDGTDWIDLVQDSLGQSKTNQYHYK